MSPEGATESSPGREPGVEMFYETERRRCGTKPLRHKRVAPSGLITFATSYHGLTPGATRCRPFGAGCGRPQNSRFQVGAPGRAPVPQWSSILPGIILRSSNPLDPLLHIGWLGILSMSPAGGRPAAPRCRDASNGINKSFATETS